MILIAPSGREFEITTQNEVRILTETFGWKRKDDDVNEQEERA